MSEPGRPCCARESVPLRARPLPVLWYFQKERICHPDAYSRGDEDTSMQ